MCALRSRNTSMIPKLSLRVSCGPTALCLSQLVFMDAQRFENFSWVPADPLQHAAATVGSLYYCTMMVSSFLFSFAVECSHNVMTWGTERSA